MSHFHILCLCKYILYLLCKYTKVYLYLLMCLQSEGSANCSVKHQIINILGSAIQSLSQVLNSAMDTVFPTKLYL